MTSTTLTASAAATLHGYLAEFDDPHSLLEAVRSAKGAGYKKLEAYTPFPVEEVIDELHLHRTGVPQVVLACGLTGAISGFLFQTWVNVEAYPLVIGGRPLFSWPAFIPATFEMMVLFASFGAVLGMIILNGLPRFHHPLFGVEAFRRASQDRFFLYVPAEDPKFDATSTRSFLAKLTAHEVCAVED